jgi:hypothetical protein
MVLSLLFGLLCHTPAALAQAAAPNSVTDPWETVKAVPPGTELEVKLDNGKKLKGKLLEASDTTLRLSRKDEIAELDRANVLKVYQLLPRSGNFTRLATSTGAALGAGVGLAAGLSSLLRAPTVSGPGSRGSTLRGPSPRFILLPLAGAALGGAGGYAVASRMKSRMLIYDAGRRTRVKPVRASPDKP